MMRAACVLLLATLAFAAAGCATTSGPQKQNGSARATHRGGLSAAISMLYEGRVDEARKVLVKALESDPGDRRARGLLQQIDMQPEALLGQDSFRYRVRSGDTLSSLAQQHLGDPTMFYALARYNDLTLPVTLSPGSSLRIPGREKAGRPASIAKPKAAAAPVRSSEIKRAVNPQRAAKLRVAGLEQLNRGNIDQAVTLLEQASATDPNDALARRDLDRAIRIKRTVRRAQ
jgi:Tfp pilus assembly protein PilF